MARQLLQALWLLSSPPPWPTASPLANGACNSTRLIYLRALASCPNGLSASCPAGAWDLAMHAQSSEERSRASTASNRRLNEADPLRAKHVQRETAEPWLAANRCRGAEGERRGPRAAPARRRELLEQA